MTTTTNSPNPYLADGIVMMDPPELARITATCFRGPLTMQVTW
ncbi:hypothetical protein [Sorangium sp. So ce233]